MMIVEYCPGGKAVSDFAIQLELKEIEKALQSPIAVRSYSTTNIFEFIIFAIVTDRFHHDEIQFKYDGQIITIGVTGEYTPSPEGFLIDYAALDFAILKTVFEKEK